MDLCDWLLLEYRSVILQYGVPGLGEVSNCHRETLGLSVRRDEVAMHYTLISSSTLVCTHSSCCSCCDVWGASTAVILLPSDTEYASNSFIHKRQLGFGVWVLGGSYLYRNGINTRDPFGNLDAEFTKYQNALFVNALQAMIVNFTQPADYTQDSAAVTSTE